VWPETEESQGSRQLGVGGIKQDWAVGCAYACADAWAWALGLLGVGSTAVQHSTAQHSTVLYCTVLNSTVRVHA
jgi:hypothetical protein